MNDGDGCLGFVLLCLLFFMVISNCSDLARIETKLDTVIKLKGVKK